MKIGDRVKVISNQHKPKLKIGDTGAIVRKMENSQSVGVEFDRNINGHDCDGFGKDRYCWYLMETSLELIDEFKEGTIIKWYKNGELN